MDVNAEFQHTAAMLDSPILYPSPYVVMGLHGYTKHYYAGAERICAKIGEGFGAHFSESRPDLQETAFFYHPDLCGSRAQSQTRLSYAEMKQSVRSKHLASERADEVRIGISHITTTSVQHLQYLPFGERYIDQHPFGYQERFTFTGNAPRKGKRIPLNEIKYNEQRDEETGYGYFGARYMDHELMTMWLSVDPLADKYLSISPYAYCAWNPVKLVDPDGREINPVYGSDGTFRGNTKEGFTGEIVIYDGSIEFENLSVEQLYQQADHQANVQPGAADALPYSVAAGSMTDEAKSKMYTDIVSRFEGDNILGTIFSMDDVKDGKIYFDASRSGNWATAYDENGNLGDGSKIYATDHYLTAYEPTVENIAASVICHEWFSHKIQGCSDATKNHQQAYVNVMNGPYWGGTTDAYKSFVQSKFTKYAGR